MFPLTRATHFGVTLFQRVDSPFCSTIVPFENHPFPSVLRNIPGNGEGSPRAIFDPATAAASLRERDPVLKTIFSAIEQRAGAWAIDTPQALGGRRGESGGTGDGCDFKGKVTVQPAWIDSGIEAQFLS